MAHQHPDKRQVPIRDDGGAAFASRDEWDSPAGKRKRVEDAHKAHQKFETDAIIASLVDTVDKLHAERVAQNAAFLKVLADRDATITALRAQLTARDAAVPRLKENRDALDALVAAQNLDIADLMQEITALQAQLAQATHDNGQLHQRAMPAESHLNLTALSDTEFERRCDEIAQELPRRARNSVSPTLRLECFLQLAGASKGRWIRELTAKSRPSGHDFEEILLYAIEEAPAGTFFPFKVKSRVDLVNPPPLRIATWDMPQQLLEDVLYMSPHNAVGVDFFVIHSGTCHAIQVKHHSNVYVITNNDVEKFDNWIELAQPLITSVTRRRPAFSLHFWGTNGCARYKNVNDRRVNCWSGVDSRLAASVHSAVTPLLGHLRVNDLGIWENVFRAASGLSPRTTTPTTRPFSNGGTFPVFDREGRLLPTSTDGKFVFVFFRDVVVQLPIDHFRNGGNVVFQ